VLQALDAIISKDLNVRIVKTMPTARAILSLSKKQMPNMMVRIWPIERLSLTKGFKDAEVTKIRNSFGEQVIFPSDIILRDSKEVRNN
jgi:hypothetical protein